MTETINTETIVTEQIRETFRQESQGVTVRMALITCPCERRLALVSSYKCLYCGVWFCRRCAEEHFGKTVAEYRAGEARG